ncbi:hypothetical protein Q8A67_006193 [Cirrhinus molitorella]|uniref:Ig-like domain-containing protein n=1 Tax=Cirrhinus molitorella TaxID=172907 RepID=A0AA88TTA5_9TELE|nr:hypothetical protein Q8A67_006193 [Cirrhinus molitorella]
MSITTSEGKLSARRYISGRRNRAVGSASPGCRGARAAGAPPDVPQQSSGTSGAPPCRFTTSSIVRCLCRGGPFTTASSWPQESGAARCSVGVILESPVHPVTEGDTLTLRCLYQLLTPPNLRADFYKDGSLIQSQTTEIIITTVSKSHEGFYYCKHTERGDSPKSWISVTVSHPESQMSVLHVFSSVLAVCPYLLVTVVLIFKCCKMRDETMDFRHDTQKKTVKRLIQEGESDLPEHIDVSVRKKQPMDLSDLCREEDSSVESRLWQNESPEPSCVSMKSDWSMEHPIHFSLGESSADLREGLLKITLLILRKMNQTDLANTLQTTNAENAGPSTDVAQGKSHCQTTMFECNRGKPVSTALSAKLTNLLAQWIATSCQPISVAEDDGLELVLQVATGDPS